MYNCDDKVICILQDTLGYLIVGDIYRIVGIDTYTKRVQIGGLQVLVWVPYEYVIHLNEVTKLLYVNKYNMDWSEYYA